MNTTRYLQNFSKIQENILESSFVKTLKDYNITPAEQTQFFVQILQVAMSGAMNLEELEFKDRQIALEEEKTRQELELSILQAKAQIKQLQSEALKALIQAQSMLRSVTDNAAISKSNAYVGFLNTAANATNASALNAHSTNVINTINLIDTKPFEQYEDILGNIKETLKDLTNAGEGSAEVFIYTPKMEIELDEVIKIKGFSVYGNNETKFIVQGEERANTRTILFQPKDYGEAKITFAAKNNQGEWVSDTITLLVVKAP